MSKKEEKKMRERMASDRNSAKSDYNDITKAQAPERQATNERYGARYGELQKGFGSMAETGGIDPGEAARLRTGYQGMSETGGFDPSTTGNLKSFYGGMRNTGGYSPQDVANIRGRGNAGIPAVYGRLKENLRQAQARSGGAGYQAALTKMGRGAAQDSATMARDTEAEIADRLRQGKLTGAAGEFGLEQTLAGNKFQGLQGGQGLEQSLRSGRQYGLQGLGGLAGDDLQQQQFFDKSKFANRQAVDSANQGTYSPDLSLATRPGWGANLMQGLGTAASLASTFMGIPGMSGGGGGGTPGGNVPISNTGVFSQGLGPSTADWLYAKPQIPVPGGR